MGLAARRDRSLAGLPRAGRHVVDKLIRVSLQAEGCDGMYKFGNVVFASW